MLNYLKNSYIDICTNGLRIPFAYDSLTKKPSITLFFSFVTFIIMVISLICLHFFKQILEATLLSVFIWVLALVFYRLRELDKINLNLKTGSIGLEDDDISTNNKDGK